MRPQVKFSWVLLGASITTLMLYCLLMSSHDTVELFSQGPRPRDSFFGSPYDIENETNSVQQSRYCNIYNLSEPYDTDLDCLQTKLKPAFSICIHNIFIDNILSVELMHTGLWESQVRVDIQEILLRNPGMGFIDIGANVGFYSLLAASVGSRVVAVEPFIDNIRRFHTAVRLNKFQDRVVLLENGVANVRSPATLRTAADNQGDTRLKVGYEPCVGSCPDVVDLIVMDDLLEVIKFRQAIIKIDIQGFEHLAFSHAEKLFQNVFVPYIFMEWVLMAEFYKSSNHTSVDKMMVIGLIDYLVQKGYVPITLSVEGANKLDTAIWQKWPFDIVWEHKSVAKEHHKLLKKLMLSNSFS